jgi:hypothetical protein
MYLSRLQVDFSGEKHILGVITDTVARLYVIEYCQGRFGGFRARENFKQAFSA